MIDTWGNKLATSELASVLPTFIKYSEGTKAATKQVTAIGVASKYMILILFIPLALTGSMGVFWNLIDVLQILAFILFLNVEFPINISQFFEIFEFANLDFLPNIPVYLNLEYGWIPDDFFDLYNIAPISFKNRDLSCFFLINGGLFITNIILLTALWGTLCGLNSIMKFREPSSSRVGMRALLRLSLESMEWNVYIRYLL